MIVERIADPKARPITPDPQVTKKLAKKHSPQPDKRQSIPLSPATNEAPLQYGGMPLEQALEALGHTDFIVEQPLGPAARHNKPEPLMEAMPPTSLTRRSSALYWQ